MPLRQSISQKLDEWEKKMSLGMTEKLDSVILRVLKWRQGGIMHT